MRKRERGEPVPKENVDHVFISFVYFFAMERAEQRTSLAWRVSQDFHFYYCPLAPFSLGKRESIETSPSQTIGSFSKFPRGFATDLRSLTKLEGGFEVSREVKALALALKCALNNRRITQKDVIVTINDVAIFNYNS